MFESDIERLLLLRKIPSDHRERFRVLGKLPRKGARIGLRNGREPPRVVT